MPNTSRPPQQQACPKCGSRHGQPIEFAYSQSVRISDNAHRTISEYGMTIAPPEKRSLLAGPLFVGIGLFSGALLGIDKYAQRKGQLQPGDHGLFSPEVYEPALLVGVLGFTVRFLRNAVYNATEWTDMYKQWREQRVCRACGNTYVPNVGSSQ